MIAYLIARIKSFGFALQGMKVLLATQPNAQLHAVITLGVVIVGNVLHLKRWEWVAILLCIGLVWMGEALNTALEFLADEVSLEKRDRIGKAKDLAAAGILIAVTVSVVIGIMIFWNHLH